jgi:GT2 family glycosyltransferase
VVCTHERAEELSGCLDALAACHATVQVVVVESGSTIPCRAVVERYREHIPDLRYVHVPEPGLSRARNAGIAMSDGRVIAFLDDDASPEPGWDRWVLAAFRDDSAVGCVGGACLPRFAGPRPRWLSDRLLQFASVTRFGERAREPRSSAEWPFGANMAFRRQALVDVGDFSVALGRNGANLLSGEDSDMVERVLRAGWRVWLEPRAAVLHTVHAERLRSRFYWRRLWSAGAGRAQNPSARTTVRLAAAVPIRLLLWLTTRDRIYLYRLAESIGYFAVRLRRVGRGN